jgi:hypothetical protein
MGEKLNPAASKLKRKIEIDSERTGITGRECVGFIFTDS